MPCSGQPTYPALEDWIEIFRHSIGSFTKTAEADPSLPEAERRAKAQQFAAAYLTIVNEVERQQLEADSSSGNGVSSSSGSGTANGSADGPSGISGASSGSLGCLELCRLR